MQAKVFTTISHMPYSDFNTLRMLRVPRMLPKISTNLRCHTLNFVVWIITVYLTDINTLKESILVIFQLL